MTSSVSGEVLWGLKIQHQKKDFHLLTMKIVSILVFGTLVPYVLGVGFVGVSIVVEKLENPFSDIILHKYVKIQKMVVKQTGNRCRGFFLKLTPVSHYDSLLDVGCEELLRPIVDGFVSERRE